MSKDKTNCHKQTSKASTAILDMAQEPNRKTSVSKYSKKRLEKRRWILLLAVILLNLANGFSWTMYSSIQDIARKYLNINSDQVGTLIEIYFWCYIIGGLPTILMTQWSLYYTLFSGAILSAVGGFVKLFWCENYTAVLIGQILLGMAQGTIYTTPVAFSYTWFGEKEVNPIISLIYYSNTLGVSIGFLIPSILTKIFDSNSESEWTQIVVIPNWILLVMTTLPAIIFIIFFKEKPKFPPSKYAVTSEKIEFRKSFNILFRKKTYVLGVLLGCIGLGVFYGFNGQNAYFQESTGLDDFTQGLYATYMGIVGLVFGTWLSYYQMKIDLITRVSLVMGSQGILGFYFLCYFYDGPREIDWIYHVSQFVLYTIIGIGLLTFFSQMLISLSVNGFPINEGLSTGFPNWLSEFFGIATNRIILAFGKSGLIVFSLVYILLAGLLGCFYKTEFDKVEENEVRQSQVMLAHRESDAEKLLIRYD